MALTSPDNLWSPDPGDDYDLTIDLAAMQDSNQQAFTALKGLTKSGVVNTSTTGSGYVTVVHGFNVSPKILISPGPVDSLADANGRLFEPVLYNLNSNNFRVRFVRRDTNAWLTDSQAVTFTWMATIA